MSRKKIIAGNWKMNHTLESGLSTFSEIINMVKDEVHNQAEVVVAPPFVFLNSFANLAKGYENISLAAQNCHQEASGAYTGEVSAAMLKSLHCSYVILGHSERRQYFGEDNALLAQKVDTVLANDLLPIFCVGETLSERESGKHFEIIASQLQEALFHLSEEAFKKLVIAYEPVWAIGTGLTASPEQAQEVHAFIRTTIANKYGDALANTIRILYGGSCNPKNAKELFAQKDIDGGLIGGASLKSRDFLDVIKSA